jgi:hypothetical protein
MWAPLGLGQRRHAALQHDSVRGLRRAISRDDAHVTAARARRPDRRERGRGWRRLEGRGAASEHEGHEGLQLQHERAVVPRDLAHARLGALLVVRQGRRGGERTGGEGQRAGG